MAEFLRLDNILNEDGDFQYTDPYDGYSADHTDLETMPSSFITDDNMGMSLSDTCDGLPVYEAPTTEAPCITASANSSEASKTGSKLAETSNNANLAEFDFTTHAVKYYQDHCNGTEILPFPEWARDPAGKPYHPLKKFSVDLEVISIDEESELGVKMDRKAAITWLDGYKVPIFNELRKEWQMQDHYPATDNLPEQIVSHRTSFLKPASWRSTVNAAGDILSYIMNDGQRSWTIEDLQNKISARTLLIGADTHFSVWENKLVNRKSLERKPMDQGLSERKKQSWRDLKRNRAADAMRRQYQDRTESLYVITDG